jgi:hypothetical protein
MEMQKAIKDLGKTHSLATSQEQIQQTKRLMHSVQNIRKSIHENGAIWVYFSSKKLTNRNFMKILIELFGSDKVFEIVGMQELFLLIGMSLAIRGKLIIILTDEQMFLDSNVNRLINKSKRKTIHQYN